MLATEAIRLGHRQEQDHGRLHPDPIRGRLADTGSGPVTINATITGLKFFFDITLGRPEVMAKSSATACAGGQVSRKP